jgi:signal transduction histidine kinase
MLADPRIKGVVANYHDITEQRKLEQQREEFISIASHELKTPVTSIKGYVQIMQDIFSTTGDSMSIDLVTKLHLQIDRLNNLIKDLLDLARIRQGQLEFTESGFDINALIIEAVSEMQLGTKKHLIVADLGVPKKITADRERMGQVLNNLISNAIKYSPESDKVMITSKSTEENITVCVQDFGIGISADAQDKIFDRFFRLHDKRHPYPGLGLGLYIASEIVKHHGGSLTVKSTPGKGSVFCFTIPVTYSPPPATNKLKLKYFSMAQDLRN